MALSLSISSERELTYSAVPFLHNLLGGCNVLYMYG
jgi:hypothetical protein